MRAYKLSFLTLIVVSTLASLTSCGVNSNIMFKVPKGELVYNDSVPMAPTTDYVIAPDDKITFTLSTNDGELILDASIGLDNIAQNNNTRIVEYLVKRDGTVELPKIHNVKVAGLTVVQCQDLLESSYATEYENPFIQVKITNQRVVVFPGTGSEAKVIFLENNNTTLMEALAQAGGITDRGKANTVKLMRRVNGQRKVYILDMSVIEGLKYADMIVQANDYIYVEPSAQVAREVLREVSPIVSIISSAAVVLTLITRLK